MKRKIVLEIDSDEKGCIDKKSKQWCPFLYTQNFGQVFFCNLWSKDQGRKGRKEPLPEINNCLQRLPECIEAESLYENLLVSKINKDQCDRLKNLKENSYQYLNLKDKI